MELGAPTHPQASADPRLTERERLALERYHKAEQELDRASFEVMAAINWANSRPRLTAVDPDALRPQRDSRSRSRQPAPR